MNEDDEAWEILSDVLVRVLRDAAKQMNERIKEEDAA